MTLSIQQLSSDAAMFVTLAVCALLGYLATWWCKRQWASSAVQAKQLEVVDDVQSSRIGVQSGSSVKKRSRKQGKTQAMCEAMEVAQSVQDVLEAETDSNLVETLTLTTADAPSAETGDSPVSSSTSARVDKIMAKKALRKARKMQLAATTADDSVEVTAGAEMTPALELAESASESLISSTDGSLATAANDVVKEVETTQDDRASNSACPNELDNACVEDFEVVDGFDHGDLAPEADDIDEEPPSDDEEQEQAVEDAKRDEVAAQAPRLVWSAVNDDNDLDEIHACPGLRTRIAEYEKVAQASQDSDRDTREHDSSTCDMDDDWEDDQSPMQDWNNDDNDSKTWWKSNWKSSWKDSPAEEQDEWMMPFDEIFASRAKTSNAAPVAPAEQNFVGDCAVSAQMQPIFLPDGQQQFYTDGDVIYMLACVEIPPTVDTTPPLSAVGGPKIPIVLEEELGLEYNQVDSGDGSEVFGYQTDDEF